MRILFITPSGGYTGSEMMLWYLLKELEKRGIEVALFSRQRNQLYRHKDEVAFRTEFYPYNDRFFYSVYDAAYSKIFGLSPCDQELMRLHREFKPDMWYLNTVTMPNVAEMARKLGVPYTVHFHELLSTFDEFWTKPIYDMLSGASRLIGCAEVVCQRVRQMGFPNVELLHSCIDTSRILPRQDPALLRARLGIPPGDFIWMMSGTSCLRKGYDLVPDIVQHLPKNAWLLWLGKEKESGVHLYVQSRTEQEGLNFIHLGAHSDDYYDYLNLCDGFVLTSREDPYPLVMIEAAFLGKPIVGFESGGISEFLLPGMGTYVSSFNPEELAGAMRSLMAGRIRISPDMLRQRAYQFDISHLTDQWLELFEAKEKEAVLV